MGNKQIIYYIGTNEYAVKTFKEYLKNTNYFLKKYEINKLPKVKYLLIIEPLETRVDHVSYSIAKIWRRRLYYRNWQTTLIVAGYAPSEHQGVLDMLDLPLDFDSFIKKLEQKEYKIYHEKIQKDNGWIETPKDEWEINYLVRGADMEWRLQLFYRGHSTRRSLEKDLIPVNMAIKNAFYNIKKGKSESYIWKEILLPVQGHWDSLYDRWQRYYPFWKITPFSKEVNEINREFPKLRKIFHDSNAITFDNIEDCHTTLDNIRTIFYDKIEPYKSLSLLAD